jgi:hypothetical protein
MGEILISGRYCVEEDKFPHVPCAQTSVALSSGALNANWPPIGSKAEQEALCRLPGHCAHSTPGGANHSGE